MQKKWLVFGLAAAIAVAAVACGGDTKTPVSPSATPAASSNLGPDNSTLKVTAPTLSAPANGVELPGMAATLVLNAATGVYVTAPALSYRFILQDATTGTQLVDSGLVASGGAQTSYAVPANLLVPGGSYRWRARAEAGGAFGPWSGFRTFTAPRTPDAIPGYFRANEIWDPLTSRVSVGIPTLMEFSADGARTISNESNIKYNLLATLESGEFSFLAYNLNPLSQGDKTKLMSMMEGDDDITDNDYRFTVEKRGVSYPAPGQVRIRVINGDAGDHANIHDSAPVVPAFEKARWYFVKLVWGNNQTRLRIWECDSEGKIGSQIADVSVSYPGRQYRPTPHRAFIGAPVGRNGPIDASVHNMTVKWVFIGGPGTTRPGTYGFAPVGFDADFGFSGPGQ